MLKVLIIDDEPKAINVLRHHIESFIPKITEVRCASSVDQAKQVLQVYKPNIVFLDIEMPLQNGFDFLKNLKNRYFDVIFTTGYNQYAIQAIRFSALDYLLKPIDPEELINAVQRHLTKKESARQKKQLYENLLKNIEKKDIKDFRLGIPSNDGVFFFSIKEILRLESDRNYTLIHLKDRSPFLASKTLKHFQDILEEFNFVRTHKSHLVNVLHVLHISKNHDFLIMCDGERIEISRRKKDEVQRLLKLY